MDRHFFVQNIKRFCAMQGIKPTVACRESGVSASFINNIESKGHWPSVEKVHMLAKYLGVSTSELLGEQTTSIGDPQPNLVMRFNALSRDDQEEILTLIDMKYQKALREVKEAEEKKQDGEE